MFTNEFEWYFGGMNVCLGNNAKLAKNTAALYEVIGASLSKPHIDELNVCNPYIIIIMVSMAPTRRYIYCTRVRNKFQHDLEVA